MLETLLQRHHAHTVGHVDFALPGAGKLFNVFYSRRAWHRGRLLTVVARVSVKRAARQACPVKAPPQKIGAWEAEGRTHHWRRDQKGKAEPSYGPARPRLKAPRRVDARIRFGA